MNSEAIDYFFADFDSLLRDGKNPREALLKTAENYAYVFFSDEQNNKHIKEKQNKNEQNIEKKDEIIVLRYENDLKNYPIYVVIYCSKNKAFFYKKGDKYFVASKHQVINMLEREQAPLRAYEKLSLRIDEG